MMKKIAIIGAGFSGLALAYHLLQLKQEVTLFDGRGIGGGTSGIASGLLHPYPGEGAPLSWKGAEGLAATQKLLKIVGKEVYKETGILRLALNEKQEKAFRKRAEEREDVEWWDAKRCHRFVKGSHYLPGIFISSGITVHSPLYLKGLWEVCRDLGARFEHRDVALKELEGFDNTICAAGGGIRSLIEKDVLDLKFNKGQVLECQKPLYFEKESSIIGKGYCALSDRKDRCFLGSTYEHTYLSESPCLGTATDLIFKQIGQFIPSYGFFKVEGCRSGIRVSNRKRLPLIGKIKEGLYVMTAMGSRGLLYHSYLGNILAKAMIEGKKIPEEVAI